VPVDDPAHVARLVWPQEVRDLRLRPGAEEFLDSTHRSDQAVLFLRREATQHGADVLTRACVERGEGLLSSFRQTQETSPTVGLGGLSGDHAALLEAAQNATQVARVQP
jgi:hypothetical protein